VIARPSFVISADVVVVVVGGRGHRVVRSVVLPRMGMLWMFRHCGVVKRLVASSLSTVIVPPPLIRVDGQLASLVFGEQLAGAPVGRSQVSHRPR